MSNYNGWTNRETWLVALYNEFDSPSDVMAFREYLEEEAEKLPAIFRDMLDLEAINWDELEESARLNEDA